MDWRAESESEEKAGSKPTLPVEILNRLRTWEAGTGRSGSVNSLILIAALIAISALVLYVFGAIISGNFNPAHWTSVQRLITASLWFVLAGPIVIYVALKSRP